jgi:sarcosine oxidase subunit gamma
MTSMAESSTRLSPVHDLIERLHPRWGVLGGMPVALALRGRTLEEEQRLARTLGLCDVSALERLVIKGPHAATFLKSREIAVALPVEVFRVLPSKAGGLIARTGGAEFFLEDGPGDGGRRSVVAQLAGLLLSSPPPDVYAALRQDASFLLSGDRALAVFRQTCAYDFRPSDSSPCPDQTTVMVLTRVAGVSTSVLRRTINGMPLYQLWADGTFGAYLWKTLLKITCELGGDAVGLSVYFPEM